MKRCILGLILLALGFVGCGDDDPAESTLVVTPADAVTKDAQQDSTLDVSDPEPDVVASDVDVLADTAETMADVTVVPDYEVNSDTGTACKLNVECDDENACTADLCDEDGTCSNQALRVSLQKCSYSPIRSTGCRLVMFKIRSTPVMGCM